NARSKSIRMNMPHEFNQRFREAQERVAPRRKAQHGQRAPAKPNGSGKVASDAASYSNDDAEISRLARLSIVQYEREPAEAAKRLGLRAPILDRLVQAEREPDGSKQGRALNLPEPRPWHEPVSGAALLDRLSAAIRAHVVAPDHVADTTALWVVHTYLLDVL